MLWLSWSRRLCVLCRSELWPSVWITSPILCALSNTWLLSLLRRRDWEYKIWGLRQVEGVCVCVCVCVCARACVRVCPPVHVRACISCAYVGGVSVQSQQWVSLSHGVETVMEREGLVSGEVRELEGGDRVRAGKADELCVCVCVCVCMCMYVF